MAKRTNINAAHLAALRMEAERIVEQDGSDALIHFYDIDMQTPCGVDLTTTPYTYGSPERDEITCPLCIAEHRTAVA